MGYLAPAIRPFRAARRVIFRLVHGWRPPHLVRARCRGVSILVWSSSQIAEGIYANAWERRERSILDQLVVPGSTVLDVGANIGFYTCLFAQAVGRHGRVLAFEPTPAALDTLRKNVTMNFFEQVSIFPVALSDQSGFAKLNVFSEKGNVYNSLGANKAYGIISDGTIDVETAPLDRYQEFFSPAEVSLVKIDVEGAEELVLRGARGFLHSDTSAVLMVEANEAAARQCGSSASAIVQALADLDWEAFVFSGESLRPLTGQDVKDLETGTAVSQDVFFAAERGRAVLRRRGLIC
jgi:FkbM family methyltransferase